MIPEQRDEPSDATRFATRPKQRVAELRNDCESKLDKIRADTIEGAMTAILAGLPGDAFFQMLDGLRDAHYIDMTHDSRRLDPVIVGRDFVDAVRRYA
jgi:hypothetical protein